MRTHRFYHPDVLEIEQIVSLSAEATHHAANVLRQKAGDTLVLFDGSGAEYVCEFSLVEKRNVQAEVQTKIDLDPQSPLELHLGQAVSKGDRMDWVLQKATELGVTAITPVISQRCNLKLDENRWQKKYDQWQKVIIGACEQSGRNTLPQLNPVLPLAEFAAQSTTATRYILSPKSDQAFSTESLASTRGIRLLIGPEGGFDQQEIHHLKEIGYHDVRFGPRVLRTETAAIAAISVLQHRLGDLC